MDPTANLKEQLELADRILATDELSSGDMAHAAIRLAELVDSLDGWLVGGGFLPETWARGRR